MGKKGAKQSQGAADACERVVQMLGPIGDVTSRKMFGGFGIFESGAMFALVNSAGEVHLKADDSNRARFEEAGASQHGKMPYFQVAPAVLEDDELLSDWAGQSIKIAHASKKK